MFRSSTTTKDETLDASHVAAVSFCNFVLENNNPYGEKEALFARFIATGNNKALIYAMEILEKKYGEEKANYDQLYENTGCWARCWGTTVDHKREEVREMANWYRRLKRANTANEVIEMTSLSK
jgi:hypothetical protein